VHFTASDGEVDATQDLGAADCGVQIVDLKNRLVAHALLVLP
jgi:hypothetical protein